MKNILIVILSVLILTSCGQTSKNETEIPHLDLLVKNMVSNMNEYKDGGDKIVLDSIIGVRQINNRKNTAGYIMNEYVAISKVTMVEGNLIKPSYMLLIITKNKNEFLVSGQMNVESLKEVDDQINNLIKYNKWK